MSTTLKSVAVAAAAFAMLGGAGAAEAGGKHFKNYDNFYGLKSGPRLRIVIGGGGYGYGYGYGCDYLYDRWQFTGRRYWKRQYLACLYGY